MPTPSGASIEARNLLDGSRRIVFVLAEDRGRYMKTHPCVAVFACTTCGADVDRPCKHPRTGRLTCKPCSTRRGIYRDTVERQRSGRGPAAVRT